LPAVVGIRYAADQQINDQLKSSLGLTMDEQQVYTAVKGAIIGPSSGLNTNGCSLVATVIPSNEIRPWQHFNPTYGLSSAVPDSEGTGSKPGRNKTSTLMADVRSSSEPLEYLQGALKDKVSVMTMINRDDIHIARSLAGLGLDSLVSVELRNWIRREFGAELPLTAIMGAGNLKGLSEKILALMPVKA
jgi:acyl carrier protein